MWLAETAASSTQVKTQQSRFVHTAASASVVAAMASTGITRVRWEAEPGRSEEHRFTLCRTAAASRRGPTGGLDTGGGGGRRDGGGATLALLGVMMRTLAHDTK